MTKAVRVTGESAAILAEDAASVVDVLTTAELTVMIVALDVDGLKALLPPYEAVTESVPAGSADVVSMAEPADSVDVPIRDAPT